MRLGERRHGCLHSAGSAAVEELHLPTETDSKYIIFSPSVFYYFDFYSSVCIKRNNF